MSSSIPKHWQEILALRSSYSGTNETFCKHHQVAISSFYKYKNMQQVQISEAPLSLCVLSNKPSAHKSTSLSNLMSALIFAQANWHFPPSLALMLSSRLLKVYQHEDVC